jgi:hypothetical protein
VVARQEALGPEPVSTALACTALTGCHHRPPSQAVTAMSSLRTMSDLNHSVTLFRVVSLYHYIRPVLQTKVPLDSEIARLASRSRYSATDFKLARVSWASGGLTELPLAQRVRAVLQSTVTEDCRQLQGMSYLSRPQKCVAKGPSCWLQDTSVSIQDFVYTVTCHPTCASKSAM